MNLTSLLYAAFTVWLAIAAPFAFALWKDRNRKPWVKTLTKDLKPNKDRPVSGVVKAKENKPS